MAKSAIKSFTTSTKAASDSEEDQVIEFKIDDDTYHAHRPKDTRFVMLATAADDGFEFARECMAFIDACLPKAERIKLSKRIKDPDDPLDIKDLVEVFRHLMEEFTGRPTESQSD